MKTTHAPRATVTVTLLDVATPAVAVAALVLSAQLGCGARALVAVAPCPDGGASVFPSCPTPDAADAAPSTLRLGRVGHWHFDDGAGSTEAHDSSENGNNGRLVSLDPSTAWVPGGHLGGALATGGVGFAAVAKSPTIDNIVNQVSLGAWIYLDGPIFDYATAASRQLGSSNNQYYHLALNQQARPHLFIHTTVPASQVVQLTSPAAEPVPLQQWIHLAGTYDGTTARLFVNGTQVDSRAATGDFGIDTTPFILGGNGNGGMVSERFPGLIDEIVLYNRALDEAEIVQLAAGVAF